MSLYKDITILTTFPGLYITSPWLYFITESLYLLISLTYFTQFSTPLHSGNHQFVSLTLFLFFVVPLFCFLDSTYKWDCMVFVFLQLILLSMTTFGPFVLLLMVKYDSFSFLNNLSFCFLFYFIFFFILDIAYFIILSFKLHTSFNVG